jgi:hypothetical protein
MCTIKIQSYPLVPYQMKTFTFFFAFFLCGLFTYAQKGDSMVSFTHKIEWHLFKGSPNNDSFVARISTLICLEVEKTSIWNGTILFKAYAVMDPMRSWVRTGYDDHYNLQHEQTHFIVTELFARKLEAELNGRKIKSAKSPIIQTTFSKWQKEMEELQKRYDLETKGGNDSEAQKTWNDRITKDLNGT